MLYCSCSRYLAAVDSEDDEDSEGLYSDEMSDSFEGGVNKSSSSHADLTSISHSATKEDDISTVAPVSSSSLVAKKTQSHKFGDILG